MVVFRRAPSTAVDGSSRPGCAQPWRVRVTSDTGAPQSVVAAVEVLHDASGTLTADDVYRGNGGPLEALDPRVPLRDVFWT